VVAERKAEPGTAKSYLSLSKVDSVSWICFFFAKLLVFLQLFLSAPFKSFGFLVDVSKRVPIIPSSAESVG
jgi:hypothetical protein